MAVPLHLKGTFLGNPSSHFKDYPILEMAFSILPIVDLGSMSMRHIASATYSTHRSDDSPMSSEKHQNTSKMGVFGLSWLSFCYFLARDKASV